jgi:hypothetical protein
MFMDSGLSPPGCPGMTEWFRINAATLYRTQRSGLSDELIPRPSDALAAWRAAVFEARR